MTASSWEGPGPIAVSATPKISFRSRARNSRVYLLVFALLFVPYAYFDHSDGWNQISRLAALHAVVVEHTIVIDDYQVFTGDKAFINGHYYSEKRRA